jgi:putative NADH-flavin reductase
MEILLIGGSGFVGSRILAEAQRRGHAVSAPRSADLDASDEGSLAAAIHGHDAVISAYGSHANPESILPVTRALLAAAKATNVRLVAVGGAGSLEVSPGERVMDLPEFPNQFKREAAAQADALALYRREPSVDWTVVSPARDVDAGERTGKYRTGGDVLLVNSQGRSEVSAEDFAAAIVDEVESRAHPRQRISVAY